MDKIQYFFYFALGLTITIALFLLTISLISFNKNINKIGERINYINQQGAVLDSKTNYIINLIITPSPKPTNAK